MGPTFAVQPPFPVLEAREIIVQSTQIQYSQTVNPSFNGLVWPHVSVATLTPADPVAIPTEAWLAVAQKPRF